MNVRPLRCVALAALAVVFVAVAPIVESAASVSQLDFYLGNGPQVFFDNTTPLVSALHIVLTPTNLQGDGALLEISPLSSDAFAALPLAVQVASTMTSANVSGALVIGNVSSSGLQSQCSRFSIPGGRYSSFLPSDFAMAPESYFTCSFDNSSVFVPYANGGSVYPGWSLYQLQWHSQRGVAALTPSYESLVLSSNASNSFGFVPLVAYTSNSSANFAGWGNLSTRSTLSFFDTIQHVVRVNPVDGSSSAPDTLSVFGSSGSSRNSTLSFGAATGLHGVCYLPTLEAFSLSLINASVVNDFGAVEDCDFFFVASIYRVSVAQQQCQHDENCAGFTTYYSNFGTELLHCYYRHSNGMERVPSSSSVAPFARMYYKKGSMYISEGLQQNCSVRFTSSGSLRLWALESNYDTAIYVDGMYVGGCSTSSSVSCGAYRQCDTVSVYKGSTVSIVPQTQQQALRVCRRNAARVLFTLTVSGGGSASIPVTAYQTALEAAGIARVQNFTSTRRITYRATSPSLGSLRMYFFVRQMIELTLEVAQTAAAVSSSTAMVTLAPPSGGVTASCGGSASFIGGASGLNDQPDVYFQCTTSFLSNASTSSAMFTSGMLQLTLETSVLNHSLPRRNRFKALFRGRSEVNSDGVPSGLVLYSPQRRHFRTLIFSNASTVADVMQTTFVAGSGYSINWLELFVGPSTPRTWPYIGNWDSLDPSKILSTARLGCIMDTIADPDGGRCKIALPTNATSFTLYVEDSNFVSNTLTFFLRSSSSSTIRSDAVTCGGSAGFVDMAPTFGNCFNYRVCSIRFIPTNPITNATLYDELVIHVPQEVALSTPCGSAASVYAEFTAKAADNCSASFQCVTSKQCLSGLDLVCDGITDCTDNSDEALCLNWQILSTNRTITTDAQRISEYNSANSMLTLVYLKTVSLASANFGTCRQVALSARATLMSVNSTACKLFILSTVASKNLADDSTATFSLAGLLNVSNGTVYGVVSSITQYADCSDSITCNNHGSATSLSSGRCVCLCASGYTGSDCSTIIPLTVQYASFLVAFYKSEIEDAGFLFETSYVATALSVVSRTTFQCLELVPFSDPFDANSSTTVIPKLASICSTVSGFSAPAILASSTLNESVFSVLPIKTVRIPVIRPLSSPVFEFAASLCSTSLGSLSCNLPRATKFDRLAISGSPYTNASFSVTIGVVSSSRRLTTGSYVIPCTNSSAVPRGYYFAVGCFIDLTPLGGLNILNISAVLKNASGSVVSTMKDDVQMVWQRSLPVPAIIIQRNVATVFFDYTPFVWSGVAFVLGGFVMMMVSIQLGRMHTREMTEFTAPARDSALSRLHQHIKSLFLQMEFFSLRRHDGSCTTKDRVSFSLCLVVVNMWIAGIFLVLIWYTSESLSSNSSLMVERYVDPMCDGSLVASTPSVSFFVEASTSVQCSQRHIAGLLGKNIFFAGWCVVDTALNRTTVKYRAGSTLAECEAAAIKTASPLQCLSSNGTFTDTTGAGRSSMWFDALIDSSFTKFTCGTIETVGTHFQALTKLDAVSQPTVPIAVQPVSNRLKQTRATSGGVYAFHVVTPNGLSDVTSNGPFRLETTMYGESVPALGTKLITQVESELYATNSIASGTFHSPITSLFEEEFKTVLSTITTSASGNLTALLPPISELPVGNVFNGFNTSAAKRGAAAAAGARKYYDVRYTFADLAEYADLTKMQEGEGITITQYLRVTTSTLGFAWAVTDALEDLSTGSSPILDQMITILRTNAGQEYWFDMDYHIYSSLFVNGEAMSLSFIYATPLVVMGQEVKSSGTFSLAKKSVSVLTWDITTLGLTRLFNGLWHHVKIVLRVENSQLKAQLIVDGETSLSAVGWNLCVSNALQSISDFPVGYQALAYNVTQRLVAGGLLWAGYFNGGLGRLDFMPLVEDVHTVRSQGTTAVRQHITVNRAAYYILGLILVGSAGGGFLYMIFFSGREMYEEAKKAEVALTEGMFFRYVSIVRSQKPDDKGIEYKALKYTTAKRWLKLTDRQFGQFLDELLQSTNQASRELHRVLYLARDALRRNEDLNVLQELPCASEWNILIAQDEDEFVMSRSWNLPCYKKQGLPEEDPFDINLFVTRQTVARDDVAAAREASAVILPALGAQLQAEANQLTSGGNTSEAFIEQMIAKRLAEQTKRSDVGNVDTGRMKLGKDGGGTQSNVTMKSGSTTATFQLPAEIKQLLLPIISVVQSVYVWMTSSPVAEAYQTYFKKFFSFVSIDVVEAFNKIPPLVTPLVQMFLGLIAFSLLMYFTAMDEYRFSWYVARYTLKRDSTAKAKKDDEAAEGEGWAMISARKEAGLDNSNNNNNKLPTKAEILEATEKKKHAAEALAYCADIPKSCTYPFGRLVPFHTSFDVNILSVKESMRVDRFLGVSKVEEKKSDANVDNKEGEETITDELGRNYLLVETPESKEVGPSLRAPFLEVKSIDGKAVPRALETVGIRCKLHKERRLAPQVQTDVWPFLNVPSCCIVINGTRCNASEGTVYVCGHRELHSQLEASELCVCDYAVCERHYRGGAADGVFADLLAVVRQAKDRGAEWVITTIFIMAANAAYTPFLKTAIMILACHPSYQCVFTRCHDLNDQTYLLAAFLCIVVVVLFGLGLPVAQMLQLRRRIGVMREIFFSHEYDHEYDELTLEEKRKAKEVLKEAVLEKKRLREADAMAQSQLRGGGADVSVADSGKDAKDDIKVESLDGTPHNSVVKGERVAASNPESSTDVAGGTEKNMLEAKVIHVEPAAEHAIEGDDNELENFSDRELKVVEWNRFLTSDPTVLGSLYKTLEFGWIYLSPIILVWKVILICPAVFLPAGTYSQMVGISATEYAFGLFMFTTAPFIAPMVDMMYRIGSIHQVLFLGLQALDYVSRYDGDPNGYGNALVLTTFGYLAFSIGCILWTVVGPQVSKSIDMNQSTVALENLGYQYTMTTSLYVVPSSDGIITHPRREGRWAEIEAPEIVIAVQCGHNTNGSARIEAVEKIQ